VHSRKSQAKLTVRAETHKLKIFIVGLAVDQHQIGPEMAIAMIDPFPGQGMIDVAAGQGASAASKFTASIKSASRVLLCRPDCSRL
jgi:RPA family protein